MEPNEEALERGRASDGKRSKAVVNLGRQTDVHQPGMQSKQERIYSHNPNSSKSFKIKCYSAFNSMLSRYVREKEKRKTKKELSHVPIWKDCQGKCKEEVRQATFC